MKKLLLVFILIILLIPNSALALNINSKSLVAQDIGSGRIFYQKEKDDVRLIASTTNIMTT